MTRRDGVSSSTNHVQVCASGGAFPAGVKSQSDHHIGVGLFLQVVNYSLLGSPQEDLVSYLDLSCGYLQGD